MIRLVLLFSALATPLAAQTALTESPGRLIELPRAPDTVMEARTTGGVVLEQGSPPRCYPLARAEQSSRWHRRSLALT